MRKNQITIDRLDDFYDEKLGNLFIRYFNQAHYNKACDLYRKLKQKSQVYGQIIVSLEQPKNNADGQEYKTLGEEILDHKNLNDLDNFNLGDMSQETIDKLPIFGDAIDKLRNCAKNVDCFEILLLKCQGYTQTEIAASSVFINLILVESGRINASNVSIKLLQKIIWNNGIGSRKLIFLKFDINLSWNVFNFHFFN